jgi:hypothetical protein
MRVIGRVIMLLWGAVTLASRVGMIPARLAKRRIVPTEAPDADEVVITAIFEPITFRSVASSFRGGTFDCWYGGGVLDLRDATLDPAGAHLQVRAVFGGGQILVPEAWRVSSKVLGIGGLGDTRERIERATDAPHLTIEGLAIFGGFAIMSEMPEAEARGLTEAVAAHSRRQRRWSGTPQVEPAV